MTDTITVQRGDDCSPTIRLEREYKGSYSVYTNAFDGVTMTYVGRVEHWRDRCLPKRQAWRASTRWHAQCGSTTVGFYRTRKEAINRLINWY